MARAKASDPQRSRSKPNPAEELNRGITTLRELSTQIDDLSQDGFPYREAVRARTELSFRETIRRLFGEKSPEYQAHKNHKLRIGSRTESAQSTTLVKDLIVALENQKADLLGLKPNEPPAPPSTTPNRSMLKPVSPIQPSDPIARPNAQNAPPLAAVTMTSTPMTVSVAMTTNLSQITQAMAPIVLTTPVAATTAPMPPAPETAPQPIRETSIQRAPQPPSSLPLSPVMANAAVVAVEKIVPLQSPTPSLPAEPALPPPSTNTASLPDLTARPVVTTAASPTTAPLRTPVPSGTIPPLPRVTPRPANIPASPIEPPPPVQPTSNSIDAPAPTPALATTIALAPIPVIPAPAEEKQQHNDLPGPREIPTTRSIPEAPLPSAAGMESQPDPPVAPVVTAPTTATVLAAPRNSSMNSSQSETTTLEILRRMCARFHLVARQLRLRKEYRPTLEITDEQDLQDLFYALLRLQFDEVGTEEWAPVYADGAHRTSYLLDWDKTVVVVKQTRSGLTTRDIAEQVTADSARYSTRPHGATLLCFIYDPDGRVGNPRGLEADLSTVSDVYRVEVIVAPK